MHKAKRKCHDTPGKESHCKRASAKAPGLYPSGCKSRADGFTAVDPPTLLAPGIVVLTAPADGTLVVTRRIGSMRAGFREPPLHPPAAVLVRA